MRGLLVTVLLITAGVTIIAAITQRSATEHGVQAEIVHPSMACNEKRVYDRLMDELHRGHVFAQAPDLVRAFNEGTCMTIGEGRTVYIEEKSGEAVRFHLPQEIRPYWTNEYALKSG